MTKRKLPDNPILIPEKARNVFRGYLFDVYQWDQEMFDGSTETFEMLKRPDTVIVLGVVDNGKIIVNDEEQPGGVVRKNHLPAGRIDASDPTTLYAAQREMKEETGYEFKDWALVDIFQPEAKIEWFIYFYIARCVVAKSEPTLDAGERITVKEADYDLVKEFNTKSHFRILNDCDDLASLYKKVGWQ